MNKAIPILIALAITGVFVNDALTFSTSEITTIKATARFSVLEDRILTDVLKGNKPEFQTELLHTPYENLFMQSYVSVAEKLGKTKKEMLEEDGEKRLFKIIRAQAKTKI